MTPQLTISRLSNLLRRLRILGINEHMHVRITDKGREILNDKTLASKVIDTIIGNKDDLVKGESVQVNDSNWSITLVTTIKDDKPSESKMKDK